MGAILSSTRKGVSGYVKSLLIAAIQNNLQHGQINVVIKDPKGASEPQKIILGSTANAKGEDEEDLVATVVVKDDSNFWLPVCQNLDVGFAEAYMLQMLECDDLVQLFRIYIRNWNSFKNANSGLFSWPSRIWTRLVRKTNTVPSALQNAVLHYDTSNELFANFLSKDMTYSCPIWLTPDDSLETAQREKVHNIIRKADIQAHHHILDVGGGWAFLAMEAVRLTGCKVTAITLSKEQKSLGDKRVKAAGLEDRIEILLCDYRKCPKPLGGYDRVVSVEMIEHVGREFLHTYFAALEELLNPQDGKIVVQSSTLCEQLHIQPKTLDNFLDRYIFPGGYLPSTGEIISSLLEGSQGRLELETVQELGCHYIKALRSWRENFIANWDAIWQSTINDHGPQSDSQLEALKRKWIYYFSYCQAGFREGILRDKVVVATRVRPVSANAII